MQQPLAKILFEDTPPPLFLPCCDHYAGNIRYLRKALALQNDLRWIFDITFDLEDGAEIGSEQKLRKEMIDLMLSNENKFGRSGMRVHSSEHPLFQQEIEEIISRVKNRLAYLTVPKIRSYEEAKKVSTLLKSLCNSMGIDVSIPIHFIIETHGALQEVWSIAQIQGVECLDFGIMDFISSHHGSIPAQAMRSPEQFEHPLLIRAKSMISAAAAAFGKVASHNVTIDYKDSELVRGDALMAFQKFGFQRMWSIHPSQIQEICATMTPPESEISLAKEVLQVAQENSWGPISLNDTLYDRASYRYYWSVLKRAALSLHDTEIGALDSFFNDKSSSTR